MPVSDAGLLFEVVRAAGELGLALSQKKELEHWTKPDGSHVTEGDLAINALFEQRLRAQRPDDGWLSEETPDTPARQQYERLWIIESGLKAGEQVVVEGMGKLFPVPGGAPIMLGPPPGAPAAGKGEPGKKS